MFVRVAWLVYELNSIPTVFRHDLQQELSCSLGQCKGLLVPCPELNQHSLRNAIFVQHIYQFHHRALGTLADEPVSRSGRNIAGGAWGGKCLEKC